VLGTNHLALNHSLWSTGKWYNSLKGICEQNSSKRPNPRSANVQAVLNKFNNLLLKSVGYFRDPRMLLTKTNYKNHQLIIGRECKLSLKCAMLSMPDRPSETKTERRLTYRNCLARFLRKRTLENHIRECAGSRFNWFNAILELDRLSRATNDVNLKASNVIFKKFTENGNRKQPRYTVDVVFYYHV
jgi:hypothetical protein